MQPSQHILSNDLTVIVQPVPNASVVALHLWVKVGSANEEEHEAGISHFIEHLLFKGTSRRGVGDIAQDVESAGGEINAYTSYDQTVFHVTIAKPFLDIGLDVLSDMITNSVFDKGEIDLERQVVFDEILRGTDDPHKRVNETLMATAYQHHPYRRPVIGFRETVQTFDAALITRYFSRWYIPSNATLIAVGDVDVQDLMPRINARFGAWRGGSTPQIFLPMEPKQTSLRTKIVTDGITDAHVQIAFHIPALVHDDVPGLDLLSVVLGQGEASRLELELKSRRSLVRSIYCYTLTPRFPGVLIIGAVADSNTVDRLIPAIFAECSTITRHAITSDELKRAKITVASDSVYEKETVDGLARRIGYFHSVAGDLLHERRFYELAEKMTVTDIRDIAKRHLLPENATAAILLPRRQASRWSDRRTRALVRRAVDQKKEPKATPMGRQVNRYRLRNGVRLLTLVDRNVALVSARAVLLGGTLVERKQVSGLTQLLSRMLTRGTQNRSTAELAQEVESRAGSLYGFAGRHSFGLRLDILSRFALEGLDLFCDCLETPTFPTIELTQQRRLAQDAIRNTDDHPSTVAFNLFHRTLYGNHPYSRDQLGTLASIRSISRQHLVRYYHDYAKTDNLVIAIAGDIDSDQVADWLDKRFASLTGKSLRPSKRPMIPPLDTVRSISAATEKNQAHLIIGFLGTTLKNPDRYHLEVVAALLAGQGGILFKELRDRLGLAYHVTAVSQDGLDPGYVVIYLACDIANIKRAEDKIAEILRDLRTTPIDPRQLERAKKHLIGVNAIEMQKFSAKTSVMAYQELYGLTENELDHYSDLIDAVSPDDVSAAIARYLSPDRYVRTILAPRRDTARQK